MEEHYYNASHPAGYGGVKRLVDAVPPSSVRRENVERWLKGQRTYTLHKPARKRFDTRLYKTAGIDHLWQADLAEMGAYATLNDNYRYILTVIDVFSRYAWARAIRQKTGQEVRDAFVDIFTSDGRQPHQLQTDQGKEFENTIVQKLLREREIRFFTIKSQFKAALVERFNRTLKSKLWRYFTRQGSYKWLTALPQLMSAYNASTHRMIGVAPKDVTIDNEMELWDRQENRRPQSVTRRNPSHSFRVGDWVRLSKSKQVFDKGYLPNWTEEVFTISRIIPHANPSQYKVKDWSGEEIEGSFYAAELQLINKPEAYAIEKIVGERMGIDGQRQYLVKWLGYGSQFNSWVTDINDIARATM